MRRPREAESMIIGVVGGRGESEEVEEGVEEGREKVLWNEEKDERRDQSRAV